MSESTADPSAVAAQPSAPSGAEDGSGKPVHRSLELRFAALEAAFASLAELHFNAQASSLEVVEEWLAAYESEHRAETALSLPSDDPPAVPTASVVPPGTKTV